MHEHRDRSADLRLRGNTRPLSVRVYWPGHGQPTARRAPLLVFCIVGAGGGGAETTCRALSSDAGLVVLSVACEAPDPPRDGITVLEWAAEHAAELEADPRRLLVAGEGTGATVAAAVAVAAGERGWPVISRQVLIDPAPASWPAGTGAAVAGAAVAPATVILRCAAADLGQALRRSLGGSPSDESGRSATSFSRPR